jgi:hypothetical protein
MTHRMISYHVIYYINKLVICLSCSLVNTWVNIFIIIDLMVLV